MKECVVVVDNSNIFIEGRKYSSVSQGKSGEMDYSWRIDFGRLLAFLANGRTIHEAFLVGSRPPSSDSVWASAEQLGFQVVVHDRDSQGREKAVDTELVALGTEAICVAPRAMALVIASGDRDFIPLVKVAKRRNWHVEMAAFTSSFSYAGEMAKSVDLVRSLDSALSQISSTTVVVGPVS